MFKIDIDLSQMLALTAKVHLMPSGVTAAVQAVAKLVDEEEAAQIQKIYAAPIPVGPKGKPLWKRTGDLRMGRTMQMTSWNSATVGIVGRAEAYAVRRHELGVSWVPHRPAGGIIRLNPFAADTVKIVAPKVQKVAEDAFKLKVGL